VSEPDRVNVEAILDDLYASEINIDFPGYGTVELT
jgi:hypothetical protein